MTPKGKELYMRYLGELTESIDQAINITRAVTNGAERLNGSWTIKDQYKHITEEVMEAFAEYHHGKDGDAEIDEDMDILMTALTIFHKKGYSPLEIKFSMARMLKKFHDKEFVKFD